MVWYREPMIRAHRKTTDVPHFRVQIKSINEYEILISRQIVLSFFIMSGFYYQAV